MQQLPTVFVSGAKKCGTKTLMRFFGHHPQIIRGRIFRKQQNKLFFRITRSAFQNNRRHEKGHGILSDSFVDSLDAEQPVYRQ